SRINAGPPTRLWKEKAASNTAVAAPPGIPNASKAVMDPPSELELEDSAAMRPSTLPLPNSSWFLEVRRISPYATRLATDEPTPGTAPIRAPIKLPLRMIFGYLKTSNNPLVILRKEIFR